MAYDQELADRVRELMTGEPGVTERKMFGGLAFLLDGNMAVAAGSRGALMVRVDPAAAAELVDGRDVTPMVMRGRELAGWLQVTADAVADDGRLGRWVERGVACARTLPAKGQD